MPRIVSFSPLISQDSGELAGYFRNDHLHRAQACPKIRINFARDSFTILPSGLLAAGPVR